MTRIPLNKLKSKNALTLYENLGLNPSNLLPEQILFFMQETPKEHIYQRPAKGGGKWDYVTGAYIKKCLNYAFAWNWNFEVKLKEEKYKQVIVTGRLTVKTIHGNTIYKEQVGRADIKYRKGTDDPLDYGNDEKAAVTDCLKKCASEFGIASDIYNKDEFKRIKMEVIDIIPSLELENGNDPAKEEQIETIKNLLNVTKEDSEKWNYTQQEAADKIAELLERKR